MAILFVTKKDNMSSNCLSSMISAVTPLQWGHVSGIQCLIQSLRAINFL